MIAAAIAFLVANKAAILGGAFFLSEALAQIPGIKANSVFQLLFGWLQKQNPAA